MKVLRKFIETIRRRFLKKRRDDDEQNPYNYPLF